jgi:hypothetical protein
MWKLIENKAIQSQADSGRVVMFIGVLGFFFEDVSLDVSVAFDAFATAILQAKAIFLTGPGPSNL